MAISKQQAEEQRGASHVQNGLKTHCPKGHEYTEANTKMLKGRRYCRTCLRDYQRNANASKRALEGDGKPKRTRKAKEDALPVFTPTIPEDALRKMFAKR